MYNLFIFKSLTAVHHQYLSLKKSIIILLLLFHTGAISIWSIMGLRLHTLPNYAQQKHHQSGKIIRLLGAYIALTGSDQYWDFFAPAPYHEHQSLIVCDAIRFPNPSQHVECIGNILYQNYDADLNQVFRGFNGNRSRSYRFGEQLIALNSDVVYGKFLHYWEKQTTLSSTGSLYLIAQYRHVNPLVDANRQSNKLLWAKECC